jgi:hypothetical protein
MFSSLKYNLVQQFPYSPSQFVGPTMPRHLLPLLPKSEKNWADAAHGTRHAPPPSWRAATGRVPICVGPTWTPEGAAAARLVWTPEGAAAARLVILLVVSSSWHEDRLAQEEKRERLWS